MTTFYGAAVIPIEDSSASEGPLAPDAANSITIPPTDSATSSDGDTNAADGSTDAGDTSATTVPTDSSSAADAPMAVPFYGAAIVPDE